MTRRKPKKSTAPHVMSEEHQLELEALQSIYEEDLVMIKASSTSFHFPVAFRVRVVPFAGDEEANFCYVWIYMRFSRDYPMGMVPVTATVDDHGGLDDTAVAHIDEIIREVLRKREENEVVGFEVLMEVKEFLLDCNDWRGDSVYDEMIAGVKLREEQRKERESAVLREEKEKQLKEDADVRATQGLDRLGRETEDKLRQEWLLKEHVVLKSDEERCSDSDGHDEDCYPIDEVLIAFLAQKFAGSNACQILEACGLTSATSILQQEAKVFTREIERIQQKLGECWDSLETPLEPSTTTIDSKSRYRKDFIEMEVLGRGSYGKVMKVQNRLDGRFYAVKRISIGADLEALKRILREVTTLSRLHHQYVLRYYQAWIEVGYDASEAVEVDLIGMSSSNPSDIGLRSDSIFRFDESTSNGSTLPTEYDVMLSKNSMGVGDFYGGFDNSVTGLGLDILKHIKHSSNGQALSDSKPTYFLYIQTEYCKQTLRETMQYEAKNINPEENWRRIRQILEGLAHIHNQKIIHRDLKPSNIFHDPCGDVRIGDLGLATFKTMDNSVSTSNLQVPVNASKAGIDQTTGVGTLMYMSPEQSRGESDDGYDDKVDMYSLGVILFEMWFPFRTAHERIDCLTALRDPQGVVFPIGFESAHPRQCKLIRWLLEQNAEDRPSAMDVLERGILPPKLEDEHLKDVLRGLSNPDSSFARQLLSHLFKDASKVCQQGNSGSLETRVGEKYLRSVVDCLEDVFCIHGAQEMNTPILRSQQVGEDGTILLDSTGKGVRIRGELRLDFSSQQKEPVRRYEMGSVFKNRGKAGFPIREFLQIDFDIVKRGSVALAEAELFCIIRESLIDLAPECLGISDVLVQIGDTVLAKALLNYCKVPKNQHKSVSRYLNNSYNATQSSVRERLSQFGLAPKTISDLVMFSSLKGKNPDVLYMLKDIFKGNSTIQACITSLFTLLECIDLFNVTSSKQLQVSVFPMLSIERQFAGLVLRGFVLSNTKVRCVCIGGRYDHLLKDPLLHGCGISMDVESLIEVAVEASNSCVVPMGKLRMLAYIISTGKDAVRVRVAIATELWRIGIFCGFSDDDVDLAVQLSQAAKVNPQWLITAKDKILETSGVVKLKNMDKKTETDILRSDVTKFFLPLSSKR